MASAKRGSKATARVLYCFPKRSTFIDRDVTGLAAHFDVRTHELKAEPAWHLPFRLLHQLCWLIRHRAWTHDCICHFSGYHALLPALICRRTFVILAGSDCASIPAIGYGAHARKALGWATRKAASRASHLLPVHQSLMRRIQHYADIVPKEQGLLAFAPDNHVLWTAVPYGFDAGFWYPDAAVARQENTFITVPGPSAPNNRIHQLKGIDLVLDIAHRLPSARFTVVGLADPSAYPEAPKNVRFMGRVQAEALRDLYRGHSFHLQLSLSEGMPNALCEAMLCGCIPLVSDVSSMPDIVEGCGFVLKRRDAIQGAEACAALLAMPPEQRMAHSQAARARVQERYTPERRMRTLSEFLGTSA